MEKFTGIVRRAVADYKMISAGDKIAVGVSGGKDSVSLLVALTKLKNYFPEPFDLIAITIDSGFEGMDFSPIKKLCNEIGVEYIIHKTNIKEIVFDIRKESNPCSLCAKMRRGVFHDIAIEHGCNKVALGHNKNDVNETFLLSLFYEARVSTFRPVTYLDRKKIYMIRPLIYAEESEIIAIVKKMSLPIVQSTCPANNNTKRTYVRELIQNLSQENIDLSDHIFGAIKGSSICGW